MPTYSDLNPKIFKYFVADDVCQVAHSDVLLLSGEFHGKSDVKLQMDSMELIVKEMLMKRGIEVEEYTLLGNESGDADTSNAFLVFGKYYVLSKSGHPNDFRDFLDICISDHITPTICCVVNSEKQSLIEFSYVDSSTIHSTSYLDDDLFSITHSLISKYNIIQVLYTDCKMERIFDGWGINSIMVQKRPHPGNGNKCFSASCISEYLKFDMPVVNFQYEDACLINISDFDLVDFNLQTSQGKRLLNQWIRSPLVKKDEIERRLEIVEYFIKKMKNGCNLSGMSFMRRKIDLKKFMCKKDMNKNEIIQIYKIIEIIPETIRYLSDGFGSDKCGDDVSAISSSLKFINEDFIDPLKRIYSSMGGVMAEILNAIDLEHSEIISDSEMLDNLRKARQNVLREVDLEIEQMRGKFDTLKYTGGEFKITKTEYNNIVNNNKKGNRHCDIPIFNCTSVLKSGVTFTTKNMSNLQIELENIQSQINYEEREVLKRLVSSIKNHRDSLEIYNYIIAMLDIYGGFAKIGSQGDYCRAKYYEEWEMQNSNGARNTYEVIGMWHPAIQNDVVKNSICFTNNTCILTGPNMGGKSTFIKTLSLISLYAQIGCYVPARQASLPIFNRILMRVGARDVSSMNLSTFMVEMIELNKILRCEQFSLVLIDELGRGTSAIDGLSIIVAVKEYLIQSKNYSVITTHFSELHKKEVSLEDNPNSDVDEQVINKRMCVRNGILTYQVEDGVCDDSFAINVAEMANFPQRVIDNARKYIQGEPSK